MPPKAPPSPKGKPKTFNEKVKIAIPSNVFMISSSADSQQSNEAYNTSDFSLPDPAGKAGGASTSALLQALYDHGHEMGKISWVEVLKTMGQKMKEGGYNQTPQLSSSRYIDPKSCPLWIVPPASGRRRAVLVGVNYVGQQGELRACHNDCLNLRDYLIRAQGFRESEMLVLIDDGKHPMPTKKNIMDGLVRLTQYSQPGDVCFFSFSGHGGRTVDISGDEDDGFDETLIPVDFRENGQIVDDDLLKDFVKPMKQGVHVVVVMDCCHSGTVLDLPYTFGADQEKMSIEKNFPFLDTPDAKKNKKKKAKDEEKDTTRPNATRPQGRPKQAEPEGPFVPVSELPPPPPQGCCAIS